MKILLIHGFYLSVIAVLSFLLYDKTKKDDFVFEKSSEALETDYKLISRMNENIERAIKTNVDAEPKYKAYLDIAHKVLEISNLSELKINNIINQKEVSEIETTQLKKDAIEASERIFSLIPNQDRDDLKKKSYLTPLLKDETYWLSLNKSSNARLINQLNTIKNQITNEKANIFNYCLDKTSGKVSTGGDWFRVAIAPKKAVLVEGEKMEAEIYLAAYSKTNSNNISIKVNDNYLPTREGVALFEEKPNIGEHIIQATVTIRNPFTGDSMTVKGELKYEVLPKCSRDCAKNQ
jgi:hypothetical protein